MNEPVYFSSLRAFGNWYVALERPGARAQPTLMRMTGMSELELIRHVQARLAHRLGSDSEGAFSGSVLTYEFLLCEADMWTNDAELRERRTWRTSEGGGFIYVPETLGELELVLRASNPTIEFTSAGTLCKIVPGMSEDSFALQGLPDSETPKVIDVLDGAGVPHHPNAEILLQCINPDHPDEFTY